MELELQYDELKCFSCVLDTVVRREETQEAIVSDALPDIAMVLNVSGSILMQRCAAMENSVCCDGTVDTTVLFSGEDGGEVCALPVQVPFHCVTEASGITGEDRVLGSVTLTGIDVKVMNPRKVMVRIEVAIHFCAYTAQNQRLTTSVAQRDDALQTKTKEVEHCCVAHTAQRSFPYEESISIGAGQRRIRRLLCCTAVAYCAEARVAGTKVVLKGGVRVCARYLSDGESYTTEQYDLPVSQVLDAGGCGESAVVMGQLSLSDLEVAYYDESSIALNMELNAQCVILEKRRMELLQDAYSTTGTCVCQTSEALLCHLKAYKCQVVPFRQTLDVELPGADILDQTVVLTEVVSGGEVTPKGKLKVGLCVREASGHLMRLEQSCYIDLPVQHTGSRLQVNLLDCACVSAAGGAELRGNLLIAEQAQEESSVEYISRITGEEGVLEGDGTCPSAVLRKLQPGESLWDVGKRCRATVGDIMAVNQIKDEAEAMGRFLLIPKHR